MNVLGTGPGPGTPSHIAIPIPSYIIVTAYIKPIWFVVAYIQD